MPTVPRGQGIVLDFTRTIRYACSRPTSAHESSRMPRSRLPGMRKEKGRRAVEVIYVCEYDQTLTSDQLLDWAVRCGDKTLFAGQEPQVGGAARVRMCCEGKKWQKFRERLIAWLLLGYAFQKEYGLLPEELAISRTEKGKPYSASHPEYYFNLSHCSAACACVLSEREVGIDVERRFPFRLSLARRICTPGEWEQIMRFDGAKRERLLQVAWSMKESYVKKNGQGIGYGVERVDVTACLKNGRQDGYLVRSEERYTLAVCGARQEDVVCTVPEAKLLPPEHR